MLEIDNLKTYFYMENSTVKAVDDISFKVAKGETLGLLGESGSGKSTIGLSILRLIAPPGKIVSGQIVFQEKDILSMSENDLRKIRGAKISTIFQDPFTSLNPVFTIGDQIAETVRLHQGLSKKDSWQKAVELLGLVKIKDPASRVKNYQHQFSGGMRQRAMIAMALACQPDLLIADEPTTALDVTIQKEVLDLLKELQKELGFGILLITHNFGIIKNMCQQVLVMQKGKIVESGGTREVITSPKEEYTKNLINCLKELEWKKN